MRLAAFLCTSRHGIFYFRFPMPVARHPDRKRSHIKVSLGTREPKDAKQLARVLSAAGQSLISRPLVRAMRYDEMRDHVREHFSQMLLRFRERSAATGPASGLELDVIRTAQAVADGDVADWLELTQYEDSNALARAFCALRGIEEVPDDRGASLLAAEVQKGYRDYVARTLQHNAEFDRLSLEVEVSPAQSTAPARVTKALAAPDALTLAEVLSRYFAELARTKALAVKTEGE